MNDILNKMDADDLRNLAKHQDDVIRAYQEMAFTKDQVINALETLYRCRVNMEEARIRCDTKIRNLRYLDDKIAEKIFGDPPACVCEAEGR